MIHSQIRQAESESLKSDLKSDINVNILKLYILVCYLQSMPS